MRKLILSAGLPRSGSTLLQNILNSNPEFHGTPTSGILDSLLGIRSSFSRGVNFKTQDRLELLGDMSTSMRGFLEGYYESKDGVVFDKNRAWTNKLDIIDNILGHKETKVLWIYRDPVEIVNSMEHHYNKTILLENSDESSRPNGFSTLDNRIASYYSLIDGPLNCLRDAIENGYGDRILFIEFDTLLSNPQNVMNHLHQHINEPQYKYPMHNIQQSTYEFDCIYNYKFPHTIKEGPITNIKTNIILHPKYVNIVEHKYSKFIEFTKARNLDLLLHI